MKPTKLWGRDTGELIELIEQLQAHRDAWRAKAWDLSATMVRCDNEYDSGEDRFPTEQLEWEDETD